MEVRDIMKCEISGSARFQDAQDIRDCEHKKYAIPGCAKYQEVRDAGSTGYGNTRYQRPLSTRYPEVRNTKE